MKVSTQIKTPENWQDFETLCKKLWGEIWGCPNTIKRNGRNGQNQCGVDIYGAPQEGTEYYGIQCKGKNQYTHSQLTENEIDSEIEKAINFKPKLKAFYFTTTAVKDAKIEEYIRLKNIESRCNGSFTIDVFSWEDIVDLLKENRNTYNWYVNDCLYVDDTDVNILFVDNKQQITITPKYYAISTKYQNIVGKTKSNPIFRPMSYSSSVMLPKNTRDESWCKVDVMIENTGNTTIDDYMISIDFYGQNDFDLDDDWGAKAHTGFIYKIRSIHNPPEVLVDGIKKHLGFRPKSNKLIQNDSKSFSFWINTISEITLKWEFKARNYNKSGELKIDCNPTFEKKYERDNIKGIPSSELNIEPKIIELD